MTHAIHRFTAALTGWIPDISAIPMRRQIGIVTGVSILINIVVILIAALIFDKPVKPLEFAKPKLRARGIDLTIIPPEPEPEPLVPFTLAPTPEQPFIDSRGLNISQDAALNPIFQSDENMRAASELPASGDAPLPSQEGRSRPFNAFKTQKSFLGSTAAQPFPSAKDVPPLDPTVPSVPPPPVIAQTTPPPPPPETIDKTPEKPPEKTEAADPPPPPIEPAKTPPKPDDIAMTSKVPTAITKLEKAPATPPPLRPAMTPRPLDEQQAMLTTPVPKPQPPPRDSGYQPEQEQNRIEGNITNRGKKAVDSVATPLAKYRKQVNDAIGSRWYYYVKDPQRMSLISPGSARVSFFIDAEGRVMGIKLESNTSNESFAELCTSAVRDAREQIKDLKLPVDATVPLKDGRLECSLTFTFYNL